MLDRFLHYHKDARVEDIQFLYECGLISDNMTLMDYADAADHLDYVKKLHKKGDQIREWFTNVSQSIKNSVNQKRVKGFDF